jgi:hypothetical protein
MSIGHGHIAIVTAALFYCLACVAAFGIRRHRSLFAIFFWPALAANLVAVGVRYAAAWPMLPMYLGNAALPLCLAVLTLWMRGTDPDTAATRRGVLVLAAAIALSAVFFPKDFYLPFIKSQTLFAHLFLLFGILGKGCLLAAAAWAVSGLIRGRAEPDAERYGLHRSLRWTVWGFAFWTGSMFSGELWSYLGWGTPVVWDDPAITTAMATWFFYICLLHLHLTGSWSTRARGIYTAAGALVIFCLNCIPDMGPLRWPF